MSELSGRASYEPPLTRSLVFRTTAALALGLALAVLALLLLFGPFLRTTFEGEARALLDDQSARARVQARGAAERTIDMVRETTSQAHRTARETVSDAPLDLVGRDPERARAVVLERLDESADAAGAKVDALADELRARTARELGGTEAEVRARTESRAREFGTSVSRRAAALMLALLAALFLVHGALLLRNVISPIARLDRATRAVAGGRLDVRIPSEGSDEVARLAESFNGMTSNLAAARAELQSVNAGLEERVREQTRELRAALASARETNTRLEAALAELESKDRELRHAERMASLGTLSGGVAHEFGNILGGILGCAESGQLEDDPGEMRATLQMIERTARRGSAVTDNLLRFARPGSGERTRVRLGDVLRDVAALIAHEAGRAGVRISVPDGDVAEVHGNATELHQVFLNLATNALHAMAGRPGADDADDELVVTVQVAAEDVVVSVRDTGPGVPEDVRQRLFEPFFTTRGPEGTGLGLSVTYSIVRSHGGRIDVVSHESRGDVRGGAEFRVVLPRAGREEIAT